MPAQPKPGLPWPLAARVAAIHVAAALCLSLAEPLPLAQVVGSAPAPLEPTGTITTTTPTFVWTGTSGASSYRLHVERSDGRLVLDEQTADTVLTPAAPLAPGQAYRWQVQAWSATEGPGPWSRPATFSIAVGGLAAPTAIGPRGVIATPNPSFAWTSVPGALWYRMSVEGEDGSPIFAGETQATSLRIPSPLVPGEAYRWTVRAWNPGAGEGWASPALAFRIAPPRLLPPALVEPSGIVAANPPTLRWEPVPGAASYHVTVLAADEALVSDTWTRETSLPLPERLPPAQEFRWWARAWNATEGEGPAPSPATFATPPIGAAPAISRFRLVPATAPRDAGGGAIPVVASVDFSDPDGDVATIRITTPHGTVERPATPGPTSGTASATVAAPTTHPGAFTFLIQLLDRAGNASDTLSATFTVR